MLDPAGELEATSSADGQVAYHIKSPEVKLIDYGTGKRPALCTLLIGSEIEQATPINEKRIRLIQPELLRAPEVRVGCEWGTSADVWNLGYTVRPYLLCLESLLIISL